MEKLYWTTKDGNEIDIDNLSASHMRNILKMIVRQRNAFIEDEFEEYRDARIRELESERNDWLRK